MISSLVRNTSAIYSNRIWQYILLSVILTYFFWIFKASSTRGGPELHTLIEEASMLLALIIGTVALVRFYSKKSNFFLFLGAGFVGTAWLDAYHAFITSSFVDLTAFHSDEMALSPWSWLSSRIFVATLLLLSLVNRESQQSSSATPSVNVISVYLSTTALTLGTFIFFNQVHLPPLYFPSWLFSRPADLIVGFIFLAALWIHLKRGDWQHDFLHHWLTLALLVNCFVQLVYMPMSTEMYDSMFFASHFLKIVSYLFVLIGLLGDSYRLYRQADRSAENLSLINVELQAQILERQQAEHALLNVMSLQQAILNAANYSIISTDTQGTIRIFNKTAQRWLGYSQEEMQGKQTLAVFHNQAEIEQRAAALSNMLDTFIPPKFETFSTLAQRGIIDEQEWTYVRKDGSTFPVLLSITSLVNSNNEITGFLGIASDITERKKIDRIKREFVSTVSHELRTPLTSIQGSLGLIKGGVAGQLPEQSKALINIAYQNSERLIRLINDILDIDKIESGKMAFSYSPIEITPLIQYAIEANASFAKQYNVEYRLVQNAPGLMINADSDRLLQVLTNLMSNAAKFSPPQSQIEITISEHNHWITVSVKDFGPGIPEHFHSKIFEKFSQADSSDSRQKGGTGLGLSISRAIVEKHGGTIGFDSPTGQGAVFYFRLPKWQKVELHHEQPERKTALRRILICEDDADTATILKEILIVSGYYADIANSAEAAKDLLYQHEYDALTLDILLPGQDGISLIHELRSDPRTRQLPIVVVSGTTHNQTIPGTEQVIDWLEKPIKPEQLVASLNVAVRDFDSKLRILHVEDDNDICQIVKTILKDKAIVIAVSTLAKGRDVLAKECIDVLLLDINLPDGCGLGLLADLRSEGKKIPVIIFSASDATVNDFGPVLIKSRTSNELLLQTIQGLVKKDIN